MYACTHVCNHALMRACVREFVGVCGYSHRVCLVCLSLSFPSVSVSIAVSVFVSVFVCVAVAVTVCLHVFMYI